MKRLGAIHRPKGKKKEGEADLLEGGGRGDKGKKKKTLSPKLVNVQVCGGKRAAPTGTMDETTQHPIALFLAAKSLD